MSIFTDLHPKAMLEQGEKPIMPAVRVQYSVKVQYVAQNQRNIDATIREVAGLGLSGLRYQVYQLPDGVSFMHVLQFDSEETQHAFTELGGFQRFQAELEDHYAVNPVVERLEWFRDSGRLPGGAA